MEKTYIKMNDNRNYLSLGNIFRLVKDISRNKDNGAQKEIFCTLFDVDDIGITTVNNYAIGYRPIGVLYKKIYVDLKEKYNEDKEVFINIILSLISILDDHIYIRDNNSLITINCNKNLKKLCNELLKISINDKHIDKEFSSNIKSLIDNNNLYECIIELLMYAILENNQPLYIQKVKLKINRSELDEFLKVKILEGISYITSLQELAKKNNSYANAELGSLEYDGLVSGEVNYQKSYEYYLKATISNHPKACWMVAYMILNGKIGTIDTHFDIAWSYLNRAISLGSAAALNTMGICYRDGMTPDRKVDIDKAREYFRKASELGYTYSYNNLGIICEKDGLYGEALKYYRISADLGESWALNKVGEYYRKKGDKKTAYIYYLKSSEAPIRERNYHSYYNLARYYFLLNKTTKEKGIEYLKVASDHGVKKATNLLKKYKK